MKAEESEFGLGLRSQQKEWGNIDFEKRKIEINITFSFVAGSPASHPKGMNEKVWAKFIQFPTPPSPGLPSKPIQIQSCGSRSGKDDATR
jgi:hypothetical protein